jgi:hypothetical protein
VGHNPGVNYYSLMSGKEVVSTENKTPHFFRETGSMINATIHHFVGSNGALTDIDI